MNDLRYVLEDREQLPGHLDWLTPDERARYDGFRFDKRQQDWVLGRWAAKQALLTLAGLPQSDIARFEILAASSGAPIAMLDGNPYGAGLSISHSNARAFAVVSRDTTELGCDVELVEPRSSAFIDTFFTEAEHERVQRAATEDRDTLVTMIWSAKESTLKALRTGLGVDTRSVEVLDGGDCAGQAWGIAQTIYKEAEAFSCLWRRDGEFVLTIATREPVEPPREV